MKQRLLFNLLLCCCSVGVALGRPRPEAAPRTPHVARMQAADDHLLVYPNPSTGIVHLTISGLEGRRVEISILNLIGTVMYRETLTDLSERTTRTLDLSRFANGLYYVKLETEHTSQLSKLVIR